MSKHRIAEIKKWLKGNYVLNAEWSVKNNIAWFISELEKCKRNLEHSEIAAKGLRDLNREVLAEKEELKRELADAYQQRDEIAIGSHATVDAWDDERQKVIKLEVENKELNALFDLQRTRTKKAEKMWQEAMGKCDTIPDLGVLLDWLINEIKKLKTELTQLRK